MLVSFLASKCHNHVDKHANTVFVAGFDKCDQVRVRGRGSISFGKAELVIRSKEMRRIIAPDAFEKTISRREQFNGVDSEVANVRISGPQQIQISKVSSPGFFVDERPRVTKRANIAIRLVKSLTHGPSRREFVNDKTTIGRQGINILVEADTL